MSERATSGPDPDQVTGRPSRFRERVKRHREVLRPEQHQRACSPAMANVRSNGMYPSPPFHEANDLSAPLLGAIICCTSVPDEKRTELASHAEQMGAIHRYDLTLDVTHLIVGDYDTPKYRYVAKERPDVKAMGSEWIGALRELWMNDQEIDFEALEQQYAMPTFNLLKFSMTGCDDPVERAEIAEQVRANGGVYEGDLTKQITHLISFRTEGAKYKAAKSWGLRIVSIEWLRDSLERGMILDERLYDPLLPLEERGKNAWDRSKPKRISLGKRTRDESTATPEGNRRKLRRTASTKLSSQSQGLWGDIVGGGNGIIAQVNRSGQWGTENTEPDIQPIREKLAAKVLPPPTMDPQPAIRGIFSGCRFATYGFTPTKAQILQNHMVPHGAETVSSLEDLKSVDQSHSTTRFFLIIPHNLPTNEYPAMSPSYENLDILTEWWVERCLHHKKFIDPKEHTIGRPFPLFPIEGFAGITVSSAAFSGIDLLHVKKAVELLGGKYSEDMTPQSTVLITRSVTELRKDKYDHAQEWKIPIVSADWLWQSIEAGERLPIQKYRYRSENRRNSNPATSERSLSVEASRPRRSNSDMPNSSSRSNSNTTKPTTKMTRRAPGDTAAPKTVKTIVVNAEHDTQYPEALFPAAPSAEDIEKTEPLGEIDPNSPIKTVSTAPAPSYHPHPKPVDDFGKVLSSLLAKSKTASAQLGQTEPTGKQRRGGTRILGRAASNVSQASTSISRATSVDSTATHGNPVEWPASKAQTENGAPSQLIADQLAMEHIMNGDKKRNQEESQPPSTQLHYDDADSREYKEKVMARMLGEKRSTKKTSVKEKAITIGDLMERQVGSRRSGREKSGYR